MAQNLVLQQKTNDFFFKSDFISNFVKRNRLINLKKTLTIMKRSLNVGLNSLKTAVVAAVCVFSFTTAQAQDATAPAGEGSSGTKKDSKITLGIRAGLNQSEFRYMGSYAMTQRVSGAQLGVFLNVKLNNWVTQSLEVAWSQNGARNLPWTTHSGGAGVAEITLNNVQANLLTYFKLPVLSVYEPKVFIGPSWDINTHAGALVQGEAYGLGTKQRVAVTNNFKPLDFGIIAGAGVDFDLKFARLFLDARYRHGISDMNNKNSNGNVSYGLPGNREIRTSSFSFQVGLGFSL